VGIWQDQEYNKKVLNNDSLQANSYQYLELETFATSPDSAVNQFNLSYRQRYDLLPFQNKFNLATLGEVYNAKVNFLKNPNSSLAINSTYRKLSISNYQLSNLKPENTLLNRAEYSFNLLSGVFSGSTFYEVGSGLELKKEYSFLEVPAGQGVYAYIGDLNRNDSKDLNEFEIAPLKDLAKYIKVYTPTNDYVKVFTNQFNQVFNLNPENYFKTKAAISRFFSRFSNQTVYRIDRKTNRENLYTAINPFYHYENDNELVALNSSVRNTVFFNRTNPKFGMDYNVNRNSNKTLLTNGFELRENNTQGINVRWNITSAFYTNIQAKTGSKSNYSQFFTNRNFNIALKEIEPKISFQKGTTIRISLLYKLAQKINQASFGGEKLNAQNFGIELKYNVLAKGNFLLNVNYIINRYNSSQYSLLSFEMMEGLQAGKNITWNLSYNRNLSNNTQLSINYSGRTAANQPAVHTGGVQVRAFF
jgi:hypothetical protein